MALLNKLYMKSDGKKKWRKNRRGHRLVLPATYVTGENLQLNHADFTILEGMEHPFLSIPIISDAASI